MGSFLFINLKILNSQVFLNILGWKILKRKAIPSLLTEKHILLLLGDHVIIFKEYTSQCDLIVHNIPPHCLL